MLTGTFGKNVAVHQVSASEFEVMVSKKGKWYPCLTRHSQMEANSDAKYIERGIRLRFLEPTIIGDRIEIMPR